MRKTPPAHRQCHEAFQFCSLGMLLPCQYTRESAPTERISMDLWAQDLYKDLESPTAKGERAVSAKHLWLYKWSLTFQTLPSFVPVAIHGNAWNHVLPSQRDVRRCMPWIVAIRHVHLQGSDSPYMHTILHPPGTQRCYVSGKLRAHPIDGFHFRGNPWDTPRDSWCARFRCLAAEINHQWKEGWSHFDIVTSWSRSMERQKYVKIIYYKPQMCLSSISLASLAHLCMPVRHSSSSYTSNISSNPHRKHVNA